MAKRDRDHSGIAGADDDSQHGVLSDGNDDGDDDYEVVMRAEVEGDGGDAHGGNVHGGEADEDDGDDEVLGATHDVLPAAKPRRPSQAWAVTDVRNLEAAVRAHGQNWTAISRDKAFGLTSRAPSAIGAKYRAFQSYVLGGTGRKRTRVVDGPHPALTPPADGVCYLLTHLNLDAKRIIFANIDRRSVTCLASTCREFRRVVLMTPVLKQLLIPLTSRPNFRCPYCRKRSSCNRSMTCEEGHEISCHNTCFKRMIVVEWNHDLEMAFCPIPQCGASLVAYGRSADTYKKPHAREGIIKSMFKTVGRSTGGLRRLGMVIRLIGREDCTIM